MTYLLYTKAESWSSQLTKPEEMSQSPTDSGYSLQHSSPNIEQLLVAQLWCPCWEFSQSIRQCYQPFSWPSQPWPDAPGPPHHLHPMQSWVSTCPDSVKTNSLVLQWSWVSHKLRAPKGEIMFIMAIMFKSLHHDSPFSTNKKGVSPYLTKGKRLFLYCW